MIEYEARKNRYPIRFVSIVAETTKNHAASQSNVNTKTYMPSNKFITLSIPVQLINNV